MLFELAYPVLFAGAKTEQIATQTRVRLGLAPRELRNINYRPETRYRILCWYIRKLDIKLMMRVAPRQGAKVAITRFETTKRDPRPGVQLDCPEGLQTQYVTHDGKSVKILAYGPQDGPKALLIHGWNGRAAMLHKLSLAMAKAGYRVYVPDLPGHGGSDGNRYSFFELGQATAELFANHSEFDTIIGHSGGGVIASLALAAGLKAKTFIPIGSPASMSDIMRSYVEVSDMPAHTLTYITRHYDRQNAVSLEQSGAELMANSDTRTLVIHDLADWMVGVENAHAWADKAKHSELLLTERLTHLNILKSDMVHQRILSFIGKSDAHV